MSMAGSVAIVPALNIGKNQYPNLLCLGSLGELHVNQCTTLVINNYIFITRTHLPKDTRGAQLCLDEAFPQCVKS